MVLPNDCKVIIFKYLPLNQQLQALVTKFCQRYSGAYGSVGPMHSSDRIDYSQFTVEKMIEKAKIRVQKLEIFLQTYGFDYIIKEEAFGYGYRCDIDIIHITLVTAKILQRAQDFIL